MKSEQHRAQHSSQVDIFLLQESPVSANKADAKLSLPVLLLKVKPPKPITGQD